MMNSNETVRSQSPLTTVAALADVRAIITEIIGEEYAGDLDIGMETTFAKDIELESIELVAMAEKLRARYGEQLDLTAWLQTMDLEQIINLRVGNLVEHIVHACA